MAPEDVKKLLILVSLFLVVFLAFFFLLWRPAFSDLKRYQGELRNKEAELVQLELDAKSWPDTITREMLKEYEVGLERLWSLIPSEEKVSTLLNEIRTYAESTDLEVLSLDRVSTTSRAVSRTSTPTSSPAGKKEPEVPRYFTVPYKISLGGGYFGLIRFLKLLEDSKRLVTVTGIRMYSERDKHTLVAEIQFNIFYS